MSNVDRFILAMTIMVLAFAHTYWLLLSDTEVIDDDNAAAKEYSTFQRGLVSTYFFVVSMNLSLIIKTTLAIFINHYECE